MCNVATLEEWQKLQDDRLDTPAVGDLIWIRRRQWRVKSTHIGEGLARVVVEGRALRPAAGWAGTESRSFLLPCDRWSRQESNRHRRVSMQRALAWLAACAARAHPAWTPGAIVDSGTTILAYQLEPAMAMLAGRRRILIADAVGLGKTIQAALMIAETLVRCADARILVVAPASLLTQWSDELRSRFRIQSLTADSETFTRLRSDHMYLSNPWTQPGVWLASQDYLKQRHVMEAIPSSPFDLIVIDEAHTMAGNSQRHSAVDGLARDARRVVLLTATPHDGDAVRFRRLVTLGDTGAGADALTVFRRTRAGAVRHLRRLDVTPGTSLSRVFAGIDSFERARRSDDPGDGLVLLCAVFRKRALSSLAALAASIGRRLAIVNSSPAAQDEEAWTQPRLGFGESTVDDLMSTDEWRAITAPTGLSRSRERAWLERLLSLATRDTAAGTCSDPKIARLATLLRRTLEPVVVFTEYRDSLLSIAGIVAPQRRAAVLHGGLTGSEQRRALAVFLDGSADVLLATDVAGQGLNLQHRTRWVVHFDVPWTPMRLEQRIGRVDRIGQARTVHVTSIGVRHRAEALLRQRVAKREELRDHVALASSGRWTRAAQGLARLFMRQRSLAARWRGPDPTAIPRARVTAGLMRRLSGAGLCRSVTLIEFPLESATGGLVERWFACVAGAESIRHAPPAALLRRARTLSARARLRQERHEASRPIDAASRSLRQPGLFDPGHLRGSAGPSLVIDNPAQTIPKASVCVGEPRPLLILDLAEPCS